MNLDDDIAAWAAAVRLPADDADVIFRRIVATPAARAVSVPAAHVSAAHALATTAPGLDPAWWRQHTAGFAARMVASTAPLRYAA
jgi:hypothetical protein